MELRFFPFFRLPVAACAAALAFSCAQLSDPVVVPDLRPSLSVQSDTTVHEGEQLSVRFSASVPLNLQLVYTVEGAGAIEGQDWVWRPDYTQSGEYPVRVIAHVAGHPEWADTLEFRVVVLEDTLPGPRIDAISDTTIAENQTLVLRPRASDPRGAGTKITLAAPAGAVFDDSLFSWRPTYAQAGDYFLVFHVADFGSPVRRDSMTVRVTVTDVDRPPVLQALRDTTLDTTRTLALTLSASDPDGDAITYSLLQTPAGAALTGANFSWKPRASQAGVNVLRFVAASRALRDTVEMRVTVTVPAPPVQRPAPVAYWSFDESAGSQLNDSAGTRHATLVGATRVSGVSGGALRFNGTSYAESQSAFPDMTEQTLSAWVYPDTALTMTLIQESNTTAARDNEITLEGSNRRFIYRTRDADPKGVHTATLSAMPMRRWYYVAATAKADTVRIYINGALQTTRSGQGTFNLSNYHYRIQIGRMHDGGGDPRNYLRGMLDEVKLFDKALTAAQVLEEWNRHKAAAGY